MKAKKHGSFHQKHSLGQNFIEDETLLEQLADLSLVTSQDCVLEIGPGFGALTKPLARRAKQVVSLEIDRTLIPILNVTLEKQSNVRVICGDVMRTDLALLVKECFGEDCSSLRIAANLPYYITTDVLTKLMNELPQAQSIAVMIQKEVGDKLLSSPGEDGYGPLAVMCQYHYNVVRALDVPAACFNPPPKVDSAIVRMIPREMPEKCSLQALEKVVTQAFSQRRKMLRNNLAPLFSETELEKLNIDPTKRPEDLNVEQFVSLANHLK